MTINLYEPRDNWVLQDIADAIKKHVDASIRIRPVFYKDRVTFSDGINFFCNMGVYKVYRSINRTAPSIRDVILTTHIEKWPWNIGAMNLYRLPVTLIAFCGRWHNYFVERGIRPAGIATPGVDKIFFSITRDHARREKPAIALIGRLYRTGRKGEKWLKPLLKRVGNDFTWIIIGDRWDALLRAPFFKQYDITYHKLVTRREYYNLFRTFDIFLSLSSVEGGPLSILESMAAGIVPVVSDTGFAREVITSGKNGFIYPVGDIERLAAILRSLKQGKIGAYGQPAKEAVGEYTWERFVTIIIKVIRDVDAAIKKSHVTPQS